jgi:hypothetical protein
MGQIWRIQANMKNGGYGLRDWDEKTSYWCYYTPDSNLYLPDPGWYID